MRDRPHWTGCSANATTYAKALVNHVVHQIAETSGRAALRKVHKRL
ncbi:hypothetical protein [Methanosarcina barkeri]|nr:hypothetical protein [Methanosarcina barkeri]